MAYSILSNFLVPILIGLFIFIGLIVMAVLLYFGLFRFIGFGKIIDKILLWMIRKKLLNDDTLVEYAVRKVEQGKTEEQVKSELMLANKYHKGRIKQILYVFRKVRKEMLGSSNASKANGDFPE